MARVLFVAVLASLAFLSQAVPESAILDESYTDVVEVPSLKREEGLRKFKLHAFGNEIDLNLRRTDGLLPSTLPVYIYGEDEDGNPTVDDWTHRTDSQVMYTDKNNGASLMIEDIDGETKMNGLVGEDLIIEPVTDITVPEDGDEKREITRLRHVIYKVKKQEEDVSTFDFEELNEEVEEDNSEKRQTVNRIYIPVQVVVDYSLYKKLARSQAEVITYIKIFYNSVQSLYDSISYPSVSVSIYGIKICTSASQCSMVENSRLGSDGVNAKTALADIAKYAYSQRSVFGTDYAMMIVMTNYDMCSPQSSGTCQRTTSGLAYVATACSPYRSSKTSKTGLAEDHGAFDGLKTVAHEMGHILGMKHDGDGAALPGAPGARSCSFYDHYIMGQTKFVANQFKWSKCSVEQLRWFVVQSRASCLLVKPKPTTFNFINKLPGKEINLDNQCKILFGSTSSVGCRYPGVNSGNDKLCTGLMCKTSGNRCSSITPAAEGSYCGPQRYCQQGKCVCDPSAPPPTAPPKDPSCTSDNSRILINGQRCVPLITGSNGLSKCEDPLVKQYCCKTREKYCKATAITCDGKQPVTPKPTPPPNRFTLAPKTTRKVYVPPSSVNCGKPCTDANIRINSQSCSALLGTSSGKTKYCDNPTVIKYCCNTRARVCNGYHWITESCDSSCQDNPMAVINRQKCVPFLSTTKNRENFCDHSIVKQRCCATRSKVCNNSQFGK